MKLRERDGATRTTAVAYGETLADALRARGYAVEFDCGGRGLCGRCRALVSIGDAPPTWVKTCQTRVVEEMTVDVSRTPRLDKIEWDPYAATLDGEIDGATEEERRGELGVAVDLGTTTIACALVSLATNRVLATGATRNPQIAFGRDVLSRVGRVATEPETADQMRRLASRAIGEVVFNSVRKLGGDESQVKELVVAGNTTMEYLFSGIDPSPLGVAPFALATSEFPERSGADFDWGVARLDGARTRVLPVISAFVGGDILSGFARLTSRGAFSQDGTALLLDVGTNGEVVLASKGRFYATSTAAGPAFEGGEITQGSLASPGAINAIEYDASTFAWRARTLGNVASRGVCGSGLVDALAGLLAFGALDASGRFARFGDEVAMELRERFSTVGKSRRFLISNPGEGDVWLAQRDIRQAQLAIAAMKAGRRILLEVGGVDALDAVYLAGGFGASLENSNARRIGLVPERAATRYVGNASLCGAVDVLTERVPWSRLSELARAIEVVDLTAHNFADVFARAMRFPEEDGIE